MNDLVAGSICDVDGNCEIKSKTIKCEVGENGWNYCDDVIGPVPVDKNVGDEQMFSLWYPQSSPPRYDFMLSKLPTGKLCFTDDCGGSQPNWDGWKILRSGGACPGIY